MSKDKTLAVFRDKNGHVEIHEKYEGTPTKGARRIAHIPKWNKNVEKVEKADRKPRPPPLIEALILEPSKESPPPSPDRPSAAIDTSSTPKAAASPMHDELRKRLLATKPRAISEEDFFEFMKIVDELISDDDEKSDEDGGDDDEGSDKEYEPNLNDEIGDDNDKNVVGEPPQLAADENVENVVSSVVPAGELPPAVLRAHGDAGGPKANRHVRFSEHNDFRVIDDDAIASLPSSPSLAEQPPEAEPPSSSSSIAATSDDSSPKPILRNKTEISPINEPWMRKIQRKEEPKKREFISQTLFSDEVVERNLDAVPSIPSATPSTTVPTGPSSSASGTAAKAPPPPSTGQPRNVSKFKKMRQAKQLKK